MCYDVKTSLEAQLKRAIQKNDENAIVEISEKLVPLTNLPLYHCSGYNHPKMLIYTSESPDLPVVSRWGLVPHWVKDMQHLKKHWNYTINARLETLGEKVSFKYSFGAKHAVIHVDGFFEHHHYNKKTYPFYIKHKQEKPLALAGLWNEWVDKETGELFHTFTIITTKANKLLAKIHNNPKLKEPRMPVILREDQVDNWLTLSLEVNEDMSEPYSADKLHAHTVSRLRGREYMGNIPEISKAINYEELEFEN